MAQQVEHILGKDEVGGSSPLSSSKAFPFRGKAVFLQSGLEKVTRSDVSTSWSCVRAALRSRSSSKAFPFRGKAFMSFNVINIKFCDKNTVIGKIEVVIPCNANKVFAQNVENIAVYAEFGKSAYKLTVIIKICKLNG